MTFIAQLPACIGHKSNCKEKDGFLVELSKASQLVAALAGQTQGDQRFLFPKKK